MTGSVTSTPPGTSPSSTRSSTRSSNGTKRSTTGTTPGGPPTDASKAPTTSTRLLRRRAHGFTNPANFQARGTLITRTPPPTTATKSHVYAKGLRIRCALTRFRAGEWLAASWRRCGQVTGWGLGVLGIRLPTSLWRVLRVRWPPLPPLHASRTARVRGRGRCRLTRRVVVAWRRVLVRSLLIGKPSTVPSARRNLPGRTPSLGIDRFGA